LVATWDELITVAMVAEDGDEDVESIMGSHPAMVILIAASSLAAAWG